MRIIASTTLRRGLLATGLLALPLGLAYGKRSAGMTYFDETMRMVDAGAFVGRSAEVGEVVPFQPGRARPPGRRLR